jgi:ABC-type polysaccharide/polyol phosphate export permease
LIRYRFLLRELLARDLKVRYAGSLFGFFWAFVTSLWQLALYTIVFSFILRVPLEGEGTKNFSAFLFAGLLPWMAFSEGLSKGTLAVVDSAHLVKKLRFPSEILVLAVTSSALVHAGIAFFIFLLLRLGVGGVAWTALPLFLVGLVFQVALTNGISLLLAATYVFMRDIAHGLGLVLAALFYLTPIIYPVALVPDRFRWAVDGNPLSTLVSLYRAFLLGSPPPTKTSLRRSSPGTSARPIGSIRVPELGSSSGSFESPGTSCTGRWRTLSSARDGARGSRSSARTAPERAHC